MYHITVKLLAYLNSVTFMNFNSSTAGSVHLTINLQLEDVLFRLCLLEIKRLQNTYVMVCICIFQAYRQKNGSTIVLLHQTKPCNNMELDTKVSSHKDIIKKQKRYQNTQLMKHYLKLVQNMSGSGLVAIEPENRNILTLSISKERNILIAERFISDLAKVHGKHPVSTDGGTWYPQACRFLNLKHHIHSSYEKSII